MERGCALIFTFVFLVIFEGCAKIGPQVHQPGGDDQTVPTETTRPQAPQDSRGTPSPQRNWESEFQVTLDPSQSEIDNSEPNEESYSDLVSGPPTQPPTQPPTMPLKNQAVRSVDNGRLQNASSLLARAKEYGNDSPFEVLFPGRNRFYGTSEMIELIDFLAKYLRSLVPQARLAISDVSQKNGGPLLKMGQNQRPLINEETGNFILSHQSHRNGLDADVSYIPKEPSSRPFFDVRLQNKGAPSVSRIESLMDLKTQLEIFRQAVRSGTVDLFFVYPIVKEALCLQALREGAFEEGREDALTLETLRRTIPDFNNSPREPNHWGHPDHCHIRLKCNKKNHPLCEDAKSIVPQSHGCRLTKK